MEKGQMLACIADPFRNLEQTKQIIDSELLAISGSHSKKTIKRPINGCNSSQDNLSGYKAALIGSQNIAKMVPMMMTSAGTVRPAKFIIQGAAVLAFKQ